MKTTNMRLAIIILAGIAVGLIYMNILYQKRVNQLEAEWKLCENNVSILKDFKCSQ